MKLNQPSRSSVDPRTRGMLQWNSDLGLHVSIVCSIKGAALGVSRAGGICSVEVQSSGRTLLPLLILGAKTASKPRSDLQQTGVPKRGVRPLRPGEKKIW